MLKTLLLAAAAAAPWLSQLPPPPEPVPDLPAGGLLLVAGKKNNASFLVQDSVRRAGDVVEFWTYRVYDPPMEFFGGISQEMTHERVDCAKRTHQTLSQFAYGDAGDVRIWDDPAPPEEIEDEHAVDYFAEVLCDGVELPDSNRVTGHQAALEAARYILRMPGGPPMSERVP